jgi:phosphoglycolate phosphatase-like HAD superfamily hydrolase
MEVMQGLGLLELFDSVHFDQQDKTEVLKTLSGNGKKKSLMVGALPSDVKQARAANTDSLYITRTSPERDRAKYFLPNYISDKLVD